MRDDVHVGDADAGLTVDASQLRIPSSLLDRSDHDNQSSTLPARNQDQESYLSSLLPAPVLEARLRAYESQIQGLEQDRGELQAKSSTLERKLRRIAALGTGSGKGGRVLDEAAVAKLCAAVNTEKREMELLQAGRVRDFLRIAEEGES